MVRTSECDGEKMTCDDTCSVTKRPVAEYRWPRRIEKEGFRCMVAKKQVQSALVKDKLFNHCDAEDGYCRMDDSIIVWNPKEIIHLCPNNVFDKRKFNVTGDIFQTFEPKIALQVINKFEACNRTIYSTSEGFYLTFDETADLTATEKNSETVLKLLLTDVDDIRFRSVEAFKEINKRSCELLTMQMESNRRLKDEFFKSRIINGKVVILYANNGQIYMTPCFTCDEIIIPASTDECYEYVPVRFTVENSMIQRVGALTSELIIKPNNRKISCDENYYQIQINKTHTIIMQKNTISLGVNSNSKVNVLHYPNMHDLEKVSAIHDGLLFESVKSEKHGFSVNNFIAEYVPYMNNVTINTKDRVSDFIGNFVGNINEWTGKVKLGLSIGFIIILIILTIIILAKLTSILRFCWNCCKCFKMPKRKRRENIKSVNIALRRQPELVSSTPDLDAVTKNLLDRM